MVKSLLAGAVVFAASSHVALALEKVEICHATGSDTNPYVLVVVPEHKAVGHIENHLDDHLLVEGLCENGLPPTPGVPASCPCPGLTIRGDALDLPVVFELGYQPHSCDIYEFTGYETVTLQRDNEVL